MKRTPLKRRSPLKSRSRPATTERRKGRLVASAPDYAALRHRVVFGEYCACGCGRRADTAHHVVARTFGGDDLIDNMIPLAGDGTRLCHGAYTTASRTFDPDGGPAIEPKAVAAGIRRYLEAHPEKLRYVVRKTSEPWLELHYPKKEAQ